MEKIDLRKAAFPVVSDISALIDKINEIVEWINEQEQEDNPDIIACDKCLAIGRSPYYLARGERICGNCFIKITTKDETTKPD